MKTWTCEWFALCTNQTTQGIDHPILGVVPCCERCRNMLDMTITHDLTPVEVK